MRGCSAFSPAGLLITAVILAGCQPAPAPGPAAPSPADAAGIAWPPYDYAGAASRGEAVFRLDPGRSRAEVLVGRAGPLARFGHEHVVVVAGLEGWLALSDTPADSRADLRFPLQSLRIDPPEARQRHGMETSMSPEEVEGTRENLMERVLDPGQFPWVSLTLADFGREGDAATAQVSISINGGVRSFTLPFAIRRAGGTVTVHGAFEVGHGELGLQPYSALGGGLRVAETLAIEFILTGTAVTDS